MQNQRQKKCPVTVSYEPKLLTDWLEAKEEGLKDRSDPLFADIRRRLVQRFG